VPWKQDKRLLLLRKLNKIICFWNTIIEKLRVREKYKKEHELLDATQ